MARKRKYENKEEAIKARKIKQMEYYWKNKIKLNKYSKDYYAKLKAGNTNNDNRGNDTTNNNDDIEVVERITEENE